MTEIQVNDGGLTQRELIKFDVDLDGLAAAGIDLNLPLIKKIRAGVSPEPLLPPIDGAVQVYEGDGVSPLTREEMTRRANLQAKMEEASRQISMQIAQKRKTVANAINDIMGVQPMSQPSGVVYALRHRHKLTGQGADHVVAEEAAGSTPDSSPAQPS